MKKSALWVRRIPYVAASVVAHLALALFLPFIPQPEEAAASAVTIVLTEDPAPVPLTEPEPAPEPEPEVAPEPAPEPVRSKPRPVVRRPSPPPTPSEPAGDGKEEGAQQTVASSEGGMGVGLPAGDGGGTGTGEVGTGSGAGPRVVEEPKPRPNLRAILQRYLVQVAGLLRANHRYPLAARRAREQGTVKLAIRINPRGSIDGVLVKESSGFTRLDEAAVDTVLALNTLPPPPAQLGWRTRDVTLPISYRLR